MRTVFACTIAACTALLAVSAGERAFAFSQIVVEEDGNAQREGIVSVPLPPLPGTQAVEGDVPVTTDGVTRDPEPEDPQAGEGELPPPVVTDGIAPETQAGDPVSTGSTEPAGQPASNRPAQIPADETGTPNPPPPVTDGQGASQTPLPIYYGTDDLPRPVADLRERLMTIARSGDIERLAPYLESGEEATVLSFGGTVEDPIAHLTAISGDGEGIETLAIMLEILEAGYVRPEPGSDNEIFVWPYFAQTRLDTLTPPQKVELFELVTAGDYDAMLEFGAYNFYRMGITPEGRLAFFVAGD